MLSILIGAIGTLKIYAEVFTSDGIRYEVMESGSAAVIGIEEDNVTTEFLIPEFVRNDGLYYKVTEIGPDAFSFSSVTEVILPETITKISDKAFYGDVNLKKCNLPGSLQYIGELAFAKCWELNGQIPLNIKFFGSNSFQECSGISEIVFGNDVEINTGAFAYCTGVKTVTFMGLPSQVADGSLGFNSLETLNINSTTPPAFDPVKAICYPDNSSSYYEWSLDLANVTLKVPKGAADNYTSDSQWGIFTNVEVYDPNAIQNFTVDDIKYSITGDNTVAVAGYLGSSRVLSLNDEVDYNGKKYTVASIAAYAFKDTQIEEIDLPISTESIEEGAFENCSALSWVTTGYSLSSIGRYAFAGCRSLYHISLPTSVLKSIGDFAFKECIMLTSITLTDNMSIGDYAFLQSGLETVRFQSMPADITDPGFTSCPLQSIYFNFGEIPLIDPEYLFLKGEESYNTDVTLYLPTQEDCDRFKENPKWDIFRQILPNGSTPDTLGPYAKEREVSSIAELKNSRGLRALPMMDGQERAITICYDGLYIWDGNDGIVLIDNSKKSLSMTQWWQSISMGDILDGWIQGRYDENTGRFLCVRHEITSTACSNPVKAIPAQGKELTSGTSWIGDYVNVKGSLMNGNFTSSDGVRMVLYKGSDQFYPEIINDDCYVEGIFDAPEGLDGILRLIIIDTDQFIETGVCDIESDIEPRQIYSIEGIRLNKPSKGLIIVRNNDGTVRKAIVK